MFRKMRRYRQQLDRAACEKILTEEPRGVMALSGDGGYPYAVPLNHLYRVGRLYFHCAAEGHKTDAIRRDPKASFCVMNQGYRREGEWALNISSVIAFGTVREVTDMAQKEAVLRQLGNKFYPDPAEVKREVARFLPQVCILEMEIEHLTGKLVNES